jgi:cyclic-di-GMP phosphodiesterase TipF (flagellum assembly factor)
MARIVGRRRGLLILSLLGLAGLLGLGAMAPASLYAPLAGAFGLALASGLGGFFVYRRTETLTARLDKLSGEVDLMSQRLGRMESVTRLIAEQQMREHLRIDEAGPSAPVHEELVHEESDTDTSALAASVEEVTAEIGLLSGIVRELAAVVAAQDGEIAVLKATPPARLAPPAPPVPVPPPPAEPEIAVLPQAATAQAKPWTPRLLDAATPENAARVAAHESAVLAAFDGDGLEIHLQPLVSLPQRKVVSYEAVARLRVAGGDELASGTILTPDAFLSVLERHGRTTDLDRRMLQRAATVARHLAGRGSRAAVAYGLSPLSLFEPGFLRSLNRLVADEPDLAGRLIVALPQTSWRNLDAEQSALLVGLRGLIGVILDRPVDLDLDPTTLADHGVAQVKVPADMLLRPSAHEAMTNIVVEDLVPTLNRAGIQLVVTRVEREADVPDLLDLGVPLAQGTVFAPARAVRAEVLSAPAPELLAPPPPPVNDDPEPPPQRRPFRDFLRRAG